MPYQRFAKYVAILALAACSDDPSQFAGNTAETAKVATKSSAEMVDAAEGDAAAQNSARQLTCINPVSASDTARSLFARFGKAAQLATLPGGEGTEIPGLLIWPDDPKRRIEVAFQSEAREQLLFIRLTQESEWKVAGIGMGDTLERVIAINEGPINFFGFEWDYAGTVADYRGGKLEQLDGGCMPLMTLSYDAEFTNLPSGLIGDAIVPSTSKDVPKDGLKVSELGLIFGQ